ncbi:hypothetical protein SFRURICE_008883 [Spodoptera frugiperda]|nr:hypothetical protein SFRURICE_008883 [Spodoptera frugiperda]
MALLIEKGGNGPPVTSFTQHKRCFTSVFGEAIVSRPIPAVAWLSHTCEFATNGCASRNKIGALGEVRFKTVALRGIPQPSRRDIAAALSTVRQGTVTTMSRRCRPMSPDIARCLRGHMSLDKCS